MPVSRRPENTSATKPARDGIHQAAIDDWIQAIQPIVVALSGLHSGSVEITVQEGRIVYIERREKLLANNSRQVTGISSADGKRQKR